MRKRSLSSSSRLIVPEPFSAGVFLTYRCNGECRHCMYACSPTWRGDWISVQDLREVLKQLALKFNKRYPPGFSRVGVNYGLHFTGGEPFLNFNLLLEAVRIAKELKIPAVFAETNAYWCVDDEDTRKKLTVLKEAGLNGLLVSVNPFIIEHVPFQRTERVVKIGRELFGANLMIYQEPFHAQFKSLGVEGVLNFESYLQKMGLEGLRFAELIMMGRAPYKLGQLYRKHPAEAFFGESCLEELTREWHVHVDNYCNYITGYCGGISLGDARSLNTLCTRGVDLNNHPILKALLTDLKELYELAVEEFQYREPSEGYVSKCHLCVDIRKHLSERTKEFKELQPREFYHHLE
ncbi:MAG: radical SAM protein [Candidatus Bathyarchaeia archaeon]